MALSMERFSYLQIEIVVVLPKKWSLQLLSKKTALFEATDPFQWTLLDHPASTLHKRGYMVSPWVRQYCTSVRFTTLQDTIGYCKACCTICEQTDKNTMQNRQKQTNVELLQNYFTV